MGSGTADTGMSVSHMIVTSTLRKTLSCFCCLEISIFFHLSAHYGFYLSSIDMQHQMHAPHASVFRLGPDVRKCHVVDRFGTSVVGCCRVCGDVIGGSPRWHLLLSHPVTF